MSACTSASSGLPQASASAVVANTPSIPIANTPPMAFNSYDSYDWTMNETQLFASAAAMQANLLPSGYNTIVLDWLVAAPVGLLAGGA